MCGITGFLGYGNHVDFTASCQAMADSMLHRGPDAGGVWADEQAGVALGHRRLAIVDLSAAGRQPMHSAGGRYVLSFNGEIYNHADLRRELDVCWRGHSDTETLLAAFTHWGIEATLQRTVGMFAIALWDRLEQRLHLIRDRAGEKPLYYGWGRGVFYFGSELKALRCHPGFNNTINRNALCLYFRHKYIPAPYTIYQDVFKLEPGCMLSLTLANVATPMPPGLAAPATSAGMRLHRWWSLHALAEAGQASMLRDEPEALELLEHRLRESVRIQSVADVPLGAFLSGGIDSSLIVALMQAQSGKPVHTYTIGFNETAYDEAGYAKAIAAHLGTSHAELYVSPAESLAVIPKLPTLYDEPFSDVSQIPTYLVAQLARQHVTVALSGDAGDELFAGYNRHLKAQRAWNMASKIPADGRRLLIAFLKAGLAGSAFQPGQRMERLLPRRWQASLLPDKLLNLLGRIEGAKDCNDLYFNLVSEWKSPEDLVLMGREPATLLRRPGEWPRLPTFEDRMLYWDAMTYLPDDILAKVDRAAMGVSLESRVPFLDHRVIELALRIPVSLKIHQGQGKQVLRKILYKYVPRELIERPKQGFAVPIGMWLKGPLRDWAQALLDPTRLRHEGYLNPDVVALRWEQHLSGKRNWEHGLWSVLMFQAWLEANAEVARCPRGLDALIEEVNQ